MSRTGRLYGDSLYDLAAGEGLEEAIREQMEQIRELFRENPAYVKLLSQPVIPLEERKKADRGSLRVPGGAVSG